MEQILFLDDMKERHRIFATKFACSDNIEITHVYSYDEFVRILPTKKWDMMFLDHDLSENSILCDPYSVNEKTGSDAAQLIAESINPNSVKRVYLHSLNPAGRKRMMQILEQAGFKTADMPFTAFNFIRPH